MTQGILYPPGTEEGFWMDLLGAGRWWWHVPSDVDWFDKAYARLAGLTIPARPYASRSTQQWRDSIHPDDLPDVLDALRQLFASGRNRSYEAVYRHKTATGWRWFMSRGRVIAYTPNGQIEWVAGICLDIHKTMQTAQLLERDELWLSAFDRLLHGFRYITVYGPDGDAPQVEFVSPGIETFYGIPAQEVMRDAGVIRQRLPPEDRTRVQQEIANSIRARASTMVLRYRVMPNHGQDQVRHVHALARGEYLPDGRSRWFGVAIDVTQEEQLRQDLERRVEQLRATLSLLPDMWMELDAQERYISVHAHDPSLLLAPPEQIIGRSVEEMLPADLLQPVHDLMTAARRTGQPQALRYALAMQDGPHHFEARLVAKMQGDCLKGYTCLVRDITDVVHSFEQRQYALLHDQLTGLWNRQGFKECGWARWRELACQHQGFWILMLLDIDALRQVNHTLGYEAGDKLLQAIVERLKHIGHDGLLARLGADELLALLPAQVGREQAAEWMTQLHRQLSASIRLADFDYHPSLSLSWSVLSQSSLVDSSDMVRAVSEVEEGLSLVKQRCRGQVRSIEHGQYECRQREHLLAMALSGAWQRGELWLAMQPIVKARTGGPAAAEALLRWTSPEYGEVSPLEFIPLAEQSGMIIDIGKWVLLQACQWMASRSDLNYVSVNISPMQFMHDDFVSHTELALHKSALPPHRLCLEITESLLAEDLQVVRTKIEQLARLGIRFSLDDFGTGYSNLLQLSELPLNKLKIDRAFTRGLPGNPDKERIVRALINLAHDLSMKVVAEGVENSEQSEWLLDHGCDELQGYLFGKPLAATQWP